VQDKQGESSSQQPVTTPTVPTVFPTTAAAIPPVVPLPTADTATTDASAALATTTTESSLSMEEMMKAVKELEIQMIELKEVKEKLIKFEASYDKSKMTVAEKTREIKALDRKIKALEELTLDKTLVEIKKILWAKIGQSITSKWQSI